MMHHSKLENGGKMSARKSKEKINKLNCEDSLTAMDDEPKGPDQLKDCINAEDEDNDEGGIRIGDIYLPPPPPPACTFDSIGPRLVITHIENEFFKSYAGKQVLGPFHKSFTSIVGPNGSGKSNVIDSLLFVFGYRAQKIRSKKISVLIHNSETYADVQSCCVIVHFQKIIDKGEDDFEIVPNSHFWVSRTAYKDNSSFYQINGKRCQFKAVAKLLRTNGIDLDHNRFLILQGEVEQIAMMKPKAQTEHDTGMLEYLEDIIGSSRFKEPIELLSRQVEKLNEQRGEKLNRVKLVEKEKDDLEEPKNEAVAHLELENDVVRRQNTLFQRYILDCSKTKDEAELKKKEIDEGMADIKNELAKLQEEKTEKENELKKYCNKFEEITKMKEKHNENFKKLESEDVKLQEELKHKNQKRKKLLSQLKTDKERLEELESAPQKNERDIKDCEKLRGEYEEKRKAEEAAYHKAMASLNSETQQLQDEKAKFETKLIDLRKSVDEMKSALDIAQSELDIYLSIEKKEKKTLEHLKSSLERALSSISAKKKEVEVLKKSFPDLENKAENSKKGLQQLVPKLVNLEEELKMARVKLEETRSSMQNSRSHGKVQDAIIEQKRNGNILGIYGRLGDLGGIDAKHDVAASTAIGPLDNIVVDTVETGQKCINFLKRHNVGTATFIALDKMERFRANTEQTIHTPENVPRLFDLIKVKDNQVKTAFYYAIRDTLVADNLDQASRIAYSKQRPRVVTLNGELFEPSGTMSGGGRSVLKGRMGKAATVIDIDPREVKRTEQKVEELTASVTQMRRQKAEYEDCLQSAGRDLNVMKMNLKKNLMDIEGASKQESTLKEQVNEQEKRVKACESDPNRVSELETVINKKLKAYEKAASSAQEIEEKANKIHSEIMQITGGKMKGMKKKLDDINKKMEKLDAEITRLQVATKIAQRTYKKTEEKIASAEAEIKEVEGELLKFKERKGKIEEEAKDILESLKAVTQEELALGEKVDEIKGIIETVTKKETAIKSRKIEFDQEIEKYDGIIKQNKSKIVHWKKQLSQLELQESAVGKDGEEEIELPHLSAEELQELDLKDFYYQLTVLQEKLGQSRPNLAVLQEYRKKEEVYLQRVAELDEITSKRDEQRKFHEDLRKQRLNEFMSGFTIISNKLKEMYQMITLGGDAELELVDSLDPFSEGIVFSVRPPKKSWKNITNLSGGEKTLSSLALVFALHYYKPTPLYVMDEIDAALDFKNVSIVGNYIKERTKNAQFIIISLRSQMFELADRLVGIFKTYNCTKSVTINPSKYCIKTKDPPPEKDQGNLTTIPKPVLVESRT